MAVTANQYNIVIEQGATYLLDITYKDSSGDAIDLTNYTARMEVRESYTASSPLITLASSEGGSGNASGISLGDAAGTIAIVISDSDTDELTAPASNVYDLELVASNGVVTRLIEGKAAVSPGVTQS